MLNRLIFPQSEENNGLHDAVLPPRPQKSSGHDPLNSTGQSVATITNVNVDIQPHELRKAKPPRSKPAGPNADEPPSASRPEEGGREGPSGPQPHPRKQVLGGGAGGDGVLPHPSVSQSSNRPVPKRTDRPKVLKDCKPPAAHEAVEEDTMKLLQQAELENVAASSRLHHSAEFKTENQDSAEDAGDATRDVSAKTHTEERAVS